MLVFTSGLWFALLTFMSTHVHVFCTHVFLPFFEMINLINRPFRAPYQDP